MPARNWLKFGIAAVIAVACSAVIALASEIAWPPDPAKLSTWAILATAIGTFIGIFTGLKPLFDEKPATQETVWDAIQPTDEKVDQIQAIVEDLKERGTLELADKHVLDQLTETMHARDKLAEIVLAGILPQEENLRIVHELRTIAFSSKDFGHG